MVGEYVLSSAHNSSLTLEFATSFCPSYFTTEKASVAPIVSATRQVIQTNGLAYGSSLITRARGVGIVMPQSFHPLNTKEERTLLVKGEETTTPQDARASNSCVPGIHVHQENTQFSIDQFMKCVATLALGSQPRQGFARLWAKKKPGSEGKCEGMNLHIPKGAFTLGVWSLGGLPNLQRKIAGVKTQWIEKFLISLESY